MINVKMQNLVKKLLFIKYEPIPIDKKTDPDHNNLKLKFYKYTAA